MHGVSDAFFLDMNLSKAC